MYRKGEVSYQPLPLPDRVQQDDAGSLASATAWVEGGFGRPIPSG